MLSEPQRISWFTREFVFLQFIHSKFTAEAAFSYQRGSLLKLNSAVLGMLCSVVTMGLLSGYLTPSMLCLAENYTYLAPRLQLDGQLSCFTYTVTPWVKDGPTVTGLESAHNHYILLPL